MAIPQLTTAQHKRRVAQLRRAGCSGDRVVLKKCPPGVSPMLENPPPAPNLAGYLILAGFAGAALYAIFRPKKASAAEPVVTPPATCTLKTTEDFARLETWSTTKFIGVIYLPGTSEPLSPDRSDLGRSFVTSATRAPIVVVTNDGRFWTYDTGQPVESAVYRQDFCNFKPPAAVSGIAWLS